LHVERELRAPAVVVVGWVLYGGRRCLSPQVMVDHLEACIPLSIGRFGSGRKITVFIYIGQLHQMHEQ